jgi:pyruvate-formate lyase
MQQVTVGGVLADGEGEKLHDATNEVTYLCLRAARRLPLNSPTLDLRVHGGTPKRALEEAADALLAGGAHPVLLNDDRLVPALFQNTGSPVSRRSAKNYACDGCYETLFVGETDFGFGFVPAPDVIEKALNRGANFGGAGPINLRGMNNSWRTPPAEQIPDFETFWGVLLRHVRLSLHRIVRAVLVQYGEKAGVCPSPLLSALIHPCLEDGYDLTNGGARYHMFSPLMTGLSTGADALYVIEHLVYGTGQVRMEELVSCLRTNWGRLPPAVGAPVAADRVAEIRELCRRQPKFGQGSAEVDRLAARLVKDFHAAVGEVRNHPVHRPAWEAVRARYGEGFDIVFAPGVGTFEQYVFGGSLTGATADGRGAGEPIASDMSPAPLYADVEPAAGKGRHARAVALGDALKTYADPTWDLLADGAPADLNIPEDFPRDKLVEALRRFARGKGGNVLTLTVADPATLAAAADPKANPEDYNLVRVRMGGWTEFFITLFPSHQQQHRRRPLHLPD